jgi:ornithine cyclodeaminase/alanine dehydrogenase-like protein (mu-crystallin family)
MENMQLLYLSREDVVKTNLSMEEIIHSLEVMFRLKGEGKTEMPPKIGIHPQPDAFIHAMPAYIPDLDAAGVKWISGYPDNHKQGLPYINGVMVLNHPQTGIVYTIMDSAWVTAKRTGAATALAAKYLARADSRTLGIIGCGVQGESNLEALMLVQKQICLVVVYDIMIGKVDLYIEKMQRLYPAVAFVKADSPKQVVEDSDIIVTAGPISKKPDQVIEAHWFKAGAFASLVDFDCYWKPEAMRLSDKFCTDDLDQMMYYKKEGYFKQIPDVYAALGEIVCGQKAGREDDRERIISLNLGIALEDVAVGKLVYERALQLNLGVWLPL